MSLQIERRPLKATAPDMRRMLARLHTEATASLERLHAEGRMFAEADAWPSRTEFRRSIMRQLHTEGLVSRGAEKCGPRVTQSGRDLLEFLGRV